MRSVITGGTILTPFKTIENSYIIIEDGKIRDICSGNLPEADEVIHAEGYYVSPGFIDMHTHGGGGFDFMDGTAEAIIGASMLHMQYGTTSIVPTTLTSTDEELFTVFECFKEAKEQMKNGPDLLGLHLEGPYFSPAQAGAQDPRFIRNPDREHWLNILSKSNDIIRISAAPELPGALELGAELANRGIVASIGHSDAEYEQVVQAVNSGYSHVTHLYSGMSTIRRIKAYRHLGVIESSYLLDELNVEIIADGKHLPSELLKLILKCKPMDKISLVTDSSRGAGMRDGQHVLIGSLKNGQDSIIVNGVAMMPDFSCFASSVCTSDRCVRTMYKLAGASVLDSVRMMSYNPAKVLNIDSHKGSIARGMDADICIFDNDINIKAVMVGGNVTVNKF